MSPSVQGRKPRAFSRTRTENGGALRRRSILGMVTAILVAFGSFFTVPAALATEGVTVTPTVKAVVDETSLTVSVSATGLPDVQAMYAALIPKNGDPNVYAAFAMPFPKVSGGNASFDLTGRTVAASGSQALVKGQQYEVLLWKQHSAGAPEDIYGRADVTITPAQWDQLFPPAPVAAPTTLALSPSQTEATVGDTITLVASVAPAEAAGTVTFMRAGEALGAPVAVTGGSATTTLELTAAGNHEFTAVFAPADETLFIASSAAPVSVAVAEVEVPVEPAGPSLSVTPNLALDPSGATVTVKGEGYNPALQSYVFLCNDTELPADLFQLAMGCRDGSKQVTPDADGSFEVEFAVKQLDGLPTAVFTAANHRAMGDRSQDAKVVLDFAQVPVEPAGPSLSVTPNLALDPSGATVTVKGEGYNPEQDIYVFVCDDIELPTDLFKHALECRSGAQMVGSSPWAKNKFTPEGSFEFEMTVKQREGVVTSLFTSADHTAMENREQDAKVVLNFASLVEWSPKISVFLSDGVTPYTNQPVTKGETLVVRGSGFDPLANVGGIGVPLPSNQPQGNFVVFGNFADTWQPSKGATSAARKMNTESRQWAITDAVLAAINPDFKAEIEAQRVKLSTDGSFEARVLITEPSELAAGGNWGIYTYPGGVATPANPAQELSVKVNYVGEKEPEKPDTAQGSMTWGVNDKFVNYIGGPIAQGKITVTKPAKRSGNDFTFAQSKGGSWDAKSKTGTVFFSGAVNFKGHEGQLDVTLANPRIVVKSANSATMQVEYEGKMVNLASVNLAKATVKTAADGSVTWTGAEVSLLKSGEAVFAGYYSAGQELSNLNFTVGSASDEKPVIVPPKPPIKKPTPKPVPKPNPAVVPGQNGAAAGSLTWGISSAFSSYVQGKIAKGGISTQGVGGGQSGYVFPQAGGGSWNPQTQTGAIHFSGVVHFTGHGGLLSESVANPVITVHNASSATLTASGRSFALNLAGATKSVGSNGEVTWSGVPVSGGFTYGSYSLAADRLSFTAGSASTASYGASSNGTPQTKREVPAEAPATTGLEVITGADKIRPGATIEIEAPGFDPEEFDIMVVLYSDPIVLDAEAAADKNGIVRWIGKLPEDLEPGKHTLTVQGSTAVGSIIEVLEADTEKATLEVKRDKVDNPREVAVTAVADEASVVGSNAPWVWIAAALLLLIATGAVTLVVAQRRKTEGV